MPAVLIVEKTGEIKSLNLKKFAEEDLYKKCGFKTNTSFTQHAVWGGGSTGTITIYGKSEGRANFENKYDFPPPIDKTLFFGSCVLVRRNTAGEVIDLTRDQWDAAYSALFGGFEDLGSRDSEEESSSDEDAAAAAAPRTKEGYIKDDFVVDDSDAPEDTSSEEEPIPAPPKKRRTAAAAAAAPKKRTSAAEKRAAAAVAAAAEVSEEDIYKDTPELVEEEYE